MAQGKKTGGREKGVPNKRTQAMLAELQATGEMPLEYMLRVMRDEAPTDQSARDFAEAVCEQFEDADELADAIEDAILAYARQEEARLERRDHMAVSAAKFCHSTLQATAPIEPTDPAEDGADRRRPVSGSIDEIVARFTTRAKPAPDTTKPKPKR